jgi:single-strand DNA-binding protein
MSNQISIHGNIGQEPELRYTQSGMAVVEFSIGDTYGKDDKKKTTWHNIVAFGNLAENFAGSAAKGNSVIVIGRYEVEEYTKKDGSKGKSIKVVADEIGMSVRWNRWVKDQTDAVMAKIGNVFPGAQSANDFEDF